MPNPFKRIYHQAKMAFLPRRTLSLYVFWFILVAANHGAADPVCRSTRSCGRAANDIRFPFTIKGQPSGYHGYPGFELSCTANKQTQIHLPDSVHLEVLSIDYKFQKVRVRSPDDCPPTQFLHLNQSASVFKMAEGDLSNYYTLFNCSNTSGINPVPCLGSTIYAYPSDYPLDDVRLVSCKKMYDVPLPFLSFGGESFELNWAKPDCSKCYKSKGQCCGLKQDETPELRTQCYGNCNKVSPLKKGLIAGSVLGSVFTVGILIALYRSYKYDRKEKEYGLKIEKFLCDYKALRPTRFTYADIKRITNQFSCELGRGAYGTVFKGKLSTEIQVAVKVLNNTSIGKGEDFVNEVGTMARIHHVNVVRLIGFCADGFRRALVYEYLENDTLQKYISSSSSSSSSSSLSSQLGWKKLQDIALGIAKGIEYLHQGCEKRILHFDIKPHNILLDHDFNPKISDFGLARLCAKDQSAISMTTARGTIGYIAPEVFSRNFGSVSYKADVYSFGMLLLEMTGGRTATTDGNQIYFPDWIYNLFNESGEDVRVEIVEQEEEEGDGKIGKKLAVVGLWCIQWKPVDRPTMKFVVQMLEGEGDSLTPPPNPVSTNNGGHVPRMAKTRLLPQELEIIQETE